MGELYGIWISQNTYFEREQDSGVYLRNGDPLFSKLEL